MKTLEQFVNEQPDERPINFSQARVDDEDCGCLLVHYGREHGLKGRLECGYAQVSEINGRQIEVPDSEYSCETVNKGVDRKPTTYGQLRALLV